MRVHLLLLSLAIASQAGADILPEGSKAVSHQILVEGLDRFPDYTFFIFPTTMTGAASRVSSRVPLTFYKFAGPRLYALRNPAPEHPDRKIFADSATPRSKDSFHLISSVPKADKTSTIKTRYRVKAISGALIELELLKEERLSSRTDPDDLFLAGLSALGFLALGIAARARP
jgi:hypothetical protein